MSDPYLWRFSALTIAPLWLLAAAPSTPPPEDSVPVAADPASPPDIRIKPEVSPMAEPDGQKRSGTIIDTLMRDRDFSFLLGAIKAAGLEDTLASPGPVTLFAPTNAAFEKLPADARLSLMKPENKAVLSQILAHHALAGNYTAADFIAKIKADGGRTKIATLTGQTITAELLGTSVYLVDGNGNRAHVIQADKRQANGTIHVIDSLLLPLPRK